MPDPERSPWFEMLKAGIRRVISELGYEVVRKPASDGTDPGAADVPVDFDEETAATWAAVRDYTLTSPERVFALCAAVRYLVRAGVPGAFAECGVWRGGSVLAMARTLRGLGVDDRELYLFDTFTKMPPPGSRDVDIYGMPAARYHEMLASGEATDPAYSYLPLDEVRSVLESSGYPAERFHFVQGLIEETVPACAPGEIALLRLDTDYYESTRHELEHLYPRISAGGVLLVDDYGHWGGSRQATDEHIERLARQGTHLLLHRIDYSARIAVVASGVGDEQAPVGPEPCRGP